MFRDIDRSFFIRSRKGRRRNLYQEGSEHAPHSVIPIEQIHFASASLETACARRALLLAYLDKPQPVRRGVYVPRHHFLILRRAIRGERRRRPHGLQFFLCPRNSLNRGATPAASACSVRIAMKFNRSHNRSPDSQEIGSPLTCTCPTGWPRSTSAALKGQNR